MDRRDLLKMFGIGTVIVPLTAKGDEPVPVRLIEVPKFELIDPAAAIIQPFRASDVAGALVVLKMRDGSTRQMTHQNTACSPVDFAQLTTNLLTMDQYKRNQDIERALWQKK